jgi:hypothetical protein
MLSFTQISDIFYESIQGTILLCGCLKITQTHNSSMCLCIALTTLWFSFIDIIIADFSITNLDSDFGQFLGISVFQAFLGISGFQAFRFKGTLLIYKLFMLVFH